jgi:endonuclease/exonuclease/phosphatase family metal-dependent hydrolase
MSGEQGRLVQIRVILDHMREWRRTNPFTPLILMGDLNSLGKSYDPWRREASVREIMKTMKPSLTKHHHTHVLLPHQIDWIFYDELELQGSKKILVVLSDHYPVAADFRVNR